MTFSRITALDVAAYTVPTDRPESDGTLAWEATTLVAVHAEAGDSCGFGYTYNGTAAATLVDATLRDAVVGRDAMDVQGAWWAMVERVRNLGRPGIASCAISAVDVALWDLKAQLLRVPLASLLGQVRPAVRAYGSGGFTSYTDAELASQLGGWAGMGLGAVKMKVGRDPAADPDRVAVARDAIGPEVGLMVDANGAYTRRQAVEMARRFADAAVTWFEEPVSSDDLDGLRLVRDRTPDGLQVAAGEYGYDATYFRRMLDAGAVDVLQADATRCGGITGFLQVAALCDARSLPLSSHTAPALHAAICCAAKPVVSLEYFHDHVRLEGMLFERTPQLNDGCLAPLVDQPGQGFDLDRAAAAPYRVGDPR